MLYPSNLMTFLGFILLLKVAKKILFKFKLKIKKNKKIEQYDKKFSFI